MLYDIVAVLFTKSHTSTSEHGFAVTALHECQGRGMVGIAVGRLQPVLARDWYFR